jgi:DNA-binding transcriptional LysR family regulator
MNLDRFNLNLFVAFEALCKADTLTQAAGALCVTQSTLSVALRQMREYFDDELFVYKPKQKELTPLAQHLRPRVQEVLKTAKAMLMLKEQSARSDRSGYFVLVPDEAAHSEPESRPLDRRNWCNDNSGAYGISPEAAFPPATRARRYGLLAELD